MKHTYCIHSNQVSGGAPVIKFVDANLMHNVITGHSVTGTLTLVNKTILDWYSKKQATVETATYGSEFVAARTATEQMIDLRVTLRYLGANLRQVSYLFGDNQSVVKSSSIPHAKLHKRHVLLSFHRVREAIAAKILRFIHIRGTDNPADILSKAWGYQQIWQLLRPLLFWQGATNDAPPEPDWHAILLERLATRGVIDYLKERSCSTSRRESNLFRVHRKCTGSDVTKRKRTRLRVKLARKSQTCY